MIRLNNFIPRKQAENADTEQYTAKNCQAVIDKFTATNTSPSPVTFNVNLVAKGGAVGPSNRVVESKSIAPRETYLFPELVGQTLEAGDFISTWASDPASLTISASGREVT